MRGPVQSREKGRREAGEKQADSEFICKAELKRCADEMWTVGIACLFGLLFLIYKKLRKSLWTIFPA